MLAGMRATLTAAGKEGFLVDPDNAVVRPVRHSQQTYDAIVFHTLDDAVIAAQEFRLGDQIRDGAADVGDVG